MAPGKTFQNLSREKQERITRIAVEEFSNKGFDGASINAMVERMNIAKGSIFQYFGDKKGLFLFVFEQSVEMVKTYLRGVRDQSSDESLAVRLRHILDAGIRFIDDHPLLFRLYTRVLFDPKAPFRDEILSTLRRHSIDYLKSLLETAHLKGELRDGIDPDKAAFVLDAVMDRFLQAHAIRHLDSGLGIHGAPDKKINAWITDVVDIICAGVVRSSCSGHILILAAVEEEIAGLREKMTHPFNTLVGNRMITTGNLCGTKVKLLVTGPGIVNTAQALTSAVENERPRLIIQTGCAGGFRKAGVNIGDVVIATEEIDIHTGLESNSPAKVAEDLPFPLLSNGPRQFKNRFPATPEWVRHAMETLNSLSAEEGFQIHQGPFVTVSTITTSDQRAEALFEQFHPCMEQMEGAAAAQIAIFYDISFLEIRAAANLVGKRDRETWRMEEAFKNANISILKFIQHINQNLVNNCFKK